MNELATFAGAGGGILGGALLGWRTVCAIEIDPYARDVLVARQNDGYLPPFPIWNDVRTFDGREWKGRVDVVSGGFPCQDISSAGKGAGIDGARSGLWKDLARIIGEVRPRFVFLENSPVLTSRGLGTVLGDLAEMGFDAEWGVVGAHHAGAPHKRDRIWILARDGDGDGEPTCSRDGSQVAELSELDEAATDAHGHELRHEPRRVGGAHGEGPAEPADDGEDERLADANRAGRAEQWWTVPNGAQHEAPKCGGWWSAEPDVGVMVDELAAWLVGD